jgi:Tol biopolymer transport system component
MAGGCRVAASPSDAASSLALQSAADSPSPESSTPTAPSQPGVVDASVAAGLALVRPVDGVPQVFVIGEDGSARQVSGLGEHASVAVLLPIWSPDRTRLALRPQWVGSGPYPRLWVVNADGTRQRELAEVGENISWSPDSTTLLYEDSGLTVDTTGEPPRLWLLDVASGEARVIGRGTSPQWLAGGERIAYRPIPTGPVEDEAQPIVIMRLPRGEPREVVVARDAWWSPGSELLLLQQADGLHLAGPDGSGDRLLVDGFSPVWSPDGSRVAYQHGVTLEEALPIIGVVDVEGNVLWSDVVAGEPAWSPDGMKLAVEVGLDDPSIAILDAATGEVIWELEGTDPAWASRTTP